MEFAISIRMKEDPLLVSEYNNYRLKCKAVGLLTFLISSIVIVTLVTLVTRHIVVNNLALNIFYYVVLAFLACMLLSICLLLWYAITAFVVPVHSARNVCGKDLLKMHVVNEVEEDKTYNITFVIAPLMKKFVVSLEECK